jgi:hypothetical protein
MAGQPRRLIAAKGGGLDGNHSNRTDQALAVEASLRWGSWLMGTAAVGFIGYAVIFLVHNFTDSFLELSTGPNEISGE